MDWHATYDYLAPCFPETVRAELMLMEPGELREIRIRAERPTIFITGTRRAAIPWQPAAHQLEALVEALSGHSLYCREDETSHGYLTLAGGHRLGLCGRVLRHENRTQLIHISSVNLRIAAEWYGSADPILPLVYQGESLGSTLIIGPPGTGKTTLLRDLSRQVSSDRYAYQTAIIDERGELAACLEGVPQLDVGNADVLEGLTKPEAVSWLLRSASPDLIITDELGDTADASALFDAHYAGCAIVTSCHGSGITEAAARPAIASLMSRRLFSSYIVLSASGGGAIKALYDRNGSPLAMT